MTEIGWPQLGDRQEVSGSGRKQFEWLEIEVNGWKLLEKDINNLHNWKWLEMDENG